MFFKVVFNKYYILKIKLVLKNNFSESFKKILIETENKVRNLNFKELKEEDILINIVSNAT